MPQQHENCQLPFPHKVYRCHLCTKNVFAGVIRKRAVTRRLSGCTTQISGHGYKCAMNKVGVVLLPAVEAFRK